MCNAHTGYAEVTGAKKPNIELSANCREFEMNDPVTVLGTKTPKTMILRDS